MADIFISYAKEDRLKVEPLTKSLKEQGWSVWWDPSIPVGKDFDEIIEEELTKAQCVIVIWSMKSVKSKYVKGEAREGLSRGILIPIQIEPGVQPPYDLRSIQTISLINWDGSKTFPEFQKLISGVVEVLGEPPIKVEELKPAGKDYEKVKVLEETIERMEEELNIAQDLQVSMLPAACPEIEGFDLAAFSAAAREVGGDFYDFIEIDKDKAGIVIGDVTGKSVSSALVMSASRSIFRMLSEEALTVSESMIRANKRTKKDLKSGMFVALLYAVLSSENKSLNLCSAGQTQPIYLSAATGEATLVETKGDTFPLGILDEAQYEETQLNLRSGDKIILYSDGIVEAMSEKGELFGFDRLLEIVQNSQATTAESLLEEIKSKLNEFADGAEQTDDITIIVISVN